MNVFDYIEKNKDRYIDFWVNICKLEGNSHNKSDVNSVVDYIEKFAVSEGFSCTRYSFDNAADYIVIDANPDSEKGHIYIAHSDTVFDKGSFGDEAVKISGDKIYGPGVIDCKGGIAVALLSMKALCENGYNKHLRLIITSDEEVDNSLAKSEGIDIIKTMSAGFKSAFCCEVGKEGEILVARSGIIRLTIEVKGKAAHSGIAYFDGVNAIEEASQKIIRIQKSSEKDGITYSCNLITGGERINIVAPKCSFQVDIRVKCAEDKEKALSVVKEIVNTDYTGGTHSTFNIDSERMPMEKTNGNIALFEIIKEVGHKYQIEKIDNYCTSGGGSDAAYSVIAGVPTVCGIGTTGDFCHTTKEYADIDSLEKRAKLISQTILSSSPR
ncbi:MAG: M20/M25/M40 family metallo-hydrolase [Clostridia bacterium]|nr:M20/M25/M40 family metallo-hydrolase [Clostridia bacterium]